jgi:hypothetical protein
MGSAMFNLPPPKSIEYLKADLPETRMRGCIQRSKGMLSGEEGTADRTMFLKPS